MIDQGYFGPDSMIWRCFRERINLAGAGRALLLQVGNPLVGAGVEEHSDYKQEPWKRLERTLDITGKIIFGSTATADRYSASLYRRHQSVKGRTGGGKAYHAQAPELLLWVHATLIETAVTIQRVFFTPLNPRELEQLWQEAKILGELFGIPPGAQPNSWDAFSEYYQQQLLELVTSDTFYAVRASIFSPTRHPLVPEIFTLPWNVSMLPVGQVLRLQTHMLAPPELQKLMNFTPGYAHRIAWRTLRTQMRASVPLLLAQLRFRPEFIAASGYLQPGGIDLRDD